MNVSTKVIIGFIATFRCSYAIPHDKRHRKLTKSHRVLQVQNLCLNGYVYWHKHIHLTHSVCNFVMNLWITSLQIIPAICLNIILVCKISVLAITTGLNYILSAPLTYETSYAMSIAFISTNNKRKYSLLLTPIMRIPQKPLHIAIVMVLKLVVWQSNDCWTTY